MKKEIIATVGGNPLHTVVINKDSTPPVENGWVDELENIYWGIHTKNDDYIMLARHKAFISRMKFFVEKYILQTTQEVEAKTRKEIWKKVGEVLDMSDREDSEKNLAIRDDIYQRVMKK